MRKHLLPLSLIAGLLAIPVGQAAAAAPAATKTTPAAAPRTIVSQAFPNPRRSQSTGTASCPANTLRVGGGAFGASNFRFVGDQSINSSFPVGTSAWRVDMNNTTLFNSSFTVYAICLGLG